MEFEMKPYIVYIKRNEYCEIIAVNSSAFLEDTNGWIEIDSGYGDKYHHAQGNYFDKPIMDERGIYRYVMESTMYDIYEDGRTVAARFMDKETFEGFAIYERTQEEMDADYIAPTPVLSDLERIAALEQENAELKAHNEFIEECLIEMSMILYA